MRRAFTLIELLVVISIIALLIAILLPVLSSAKYTAQLTKCQVKLRSIGQVQISYAVDSNEYFPVAGARWDGGQNWPEAGAGGARVQAQHLVGTWASTNTNNEPDRSKWQRVDLRQVYYDYMQHFKDQEESMHCPFIHEKFKDDNRWGLKEDLTLSYQLYVSNNYRSKFFW